jgi:pantetheine-phosphate adenylyltransferase
MITAIYAFSGDPITYGHINIIERAKAVFDRVIVAIGENPDKKYTFNLREREEMARKCFSNSVGMPDPQIKVLSFSNLLVDFAYEQGANVIVKGVRNSADFDYEAILHSVGQSQKIGIDTHILFADPELAHVSSSAVKAIAKASGDIYEYVPLHVKQAIEEKICDQYIIGITGTIGSGKSYVGQLLADKYNCMQAEHKMVHNIDLDSIGHEILNKLTEPAYVKIRQDIAKAMGQPELLNKYGFIDRKVLGERVFYYPEDLASLNKFMEKPIMVRLRQEISEKKGIIIINCALLVESQMLHICNNNVVIVDVDRDTQKERLLNRGLSEKQIQARLNCQYNYYNKKQEIKQQISKDGYGKLWTIDNSNNLPDDKIYNTFDKIFGELCSDTVSYNSTL